ncbi:MAG: RNA pyrophosphohydrolase [Pseudomonadota bacterium]|nr:RNA pyrophosphohydrolase [Pseudomonadota bacterium]
MIDSDGFRPNVGIIISNGESKVFWARRINQNAWQFPQGGIAKGETPRDALFRELSEEVGLTCDDVEVLGSTQRWLRYYLPKRFIRTNAQPRCIGQKQIWFLLRLTSHENRVQFDTTDEPEFDAWQWVDYWHPAEAVVFFKRHVYRKALTELEPLALQRHNATSK